MTRWLRLWPTWLSATLVVAALARSEPEPEPEPEPASRPRRESPPPSVATLWPSAGVGASGIAIGRKVFHHSDLTVLYRVDPTFPQAAIDADLPDARCLAEVSIGTDGVPSKVVAESCSPTFATATEHALMQWRWAPPLDGDRPVRAATTLAVNFRPEQSR